jgi:hypothetical protein
MRRLRSARHHWLSPAAFVLIGALSACGIGTATPSADLLDCGLEEQQLGAALNVEARECLLSAFTAGTPAVFESRMTSVEGDPIIRRYFVVSASEIRIEHDARQDRYGSGQVELLSCPRIVAVDEWNRVNGDEMRAEEVFVEDACVPAGAR